MPALVAHDTFGSEAYELITETVGTSKDCVEAFLLGNQGPDPLFYAVVDPSIGAWHKLGYQMHRDRTNEVLAALRGSIEIFEDKDRAIAKAYALGFVCHYLLDSTVHPLVFAQEYALCDAGVPGLDRSDGSNVHATIECEFDEVVLTRYLNTTLQQFKPAKSILRGSAGVLKIVSTMYLYTALTVFGQVPPGDLFTRSVKLFRGSMTLLYSRNGLKRRLLVAMEEAMRDVSMYGSLSMRAKPRQESLFENASHDTWIEPATGRERTESFDDLFAAALAKVRDAAERFVDPAFNAAAAEAITCGRNFNGEPIGGTLVTAE